MTHNKKKDKIQENQITKQIKVNEKEKRKKEKEMIRYYKLFDLLNRRGMKKTDLLEIISSKTLAKLSKGDNLNTDVIDKICQFLKCQPSDIMEVVEIEEIDENTRIVYINSENKQMTIAETKATGITFDEEEEICGLNKTILENK